MHTTKKILFLLRTPPYAGWITQEAFDAILAAAAFDQTVHLLFLDEGVRQLLPGQNPSSIGRKDFMAILSALDLYEVKTWVVTEDLQARNLLPQALTIPATPLASAEIKDFLSQHDLILSF